jgi:hemoglobin
MIGGRATVHTMVQCFYDLVDQDPSYAQLRALHKPDLGPMR